MTDCKNVSFGAMRLRVKKFPMDEMCEHATIALIAKRASGKSWLIREIMYRKRDIPSSIIISKTEKLTTFFGVHVPQLFIYDIFDTEILTKLFNRQMLMIEDNKKREKIGKKSKDPRVLLIMDDCMSSKGSWVKDPNIQELFFNGRHYHVSFILSLQYSLGIPPDMRTNLDYIFILAEDFVNIRRKIYEHYAGMFPSFEVFQKVFTDLTEDYGCMVINNRIHSKNIEDKVFWYRAKDIDDFLIGSRKFKDFHKKNYDAEWNKKLPLFDYSMMNSKKNSLKLIVEKAR